MHSLLMEEVQTTFLTESAVQYSPYIHITLSPRKLRLMFYNVAKTAVASLTVSKHFVQSRIFPREMARNGLKNQK